ncbi:MAG: HAMP domain-containing protein [Nitrospirae bacterium]|nr:MAG: HAMP domain-containing protein [Nitrospirota bacterium]
MPLRLRLTLWYGTALALILVILGGALYAMLAHGLRDQIDRSLAETAAVAVRALEQHRVGAFLPFADLAAEFPELAVLDKSFQIFSPAGKVTIQSPNLGRLDIPLSRTALESALNGRATYESARFPGGSSYRLLSVPILLDGVLANIVQVGTSLRPVEEMLQRLLLVLLVSLPVALAVALGGGWFLAGRALRPVDAITLAAQRLAEGDLTQRLAVSQAQDEIGRLSATFNAMIARLETSFRQVRQFSADASHELRTPLTVMKGETELALRRARPAEDYRLVLESNLEEIDRMVRIVDELLFLSRADLGEVRIESRPVRLDALVEDVQRQAVVLGQERDVQVMMGTMEPVTVQGDELRLRELLLNLVDNAVKYSRPGEKVELALARDGATARLSVADRGIGISAEAQGRIFDRFYRTDEARAHAPKGTGLGLAICKWIVEAHHGRIEVQSAVGQGAKFTVILPVVTP